MCFQTVKMYELSTLQKQKAYMRFAKELYNLSELKHPRVIEVYACATTLNELMLLTQVRPIKQGVRLT